MAARKTKTEQPFPGRDPASALQGFTPATQEWFASAFATPTPVQSAAWTSIRSGENALVIAPTGSGKTLAAFLHAIDRLYADHGLQTTGHGSKKQAAKATTSVLYISPLKALGADVRRNLAVPLEAISALRETRGDAPVTITVGMRTGDTPSAERAALVRRPPDILITTPESLYLMLTSKARETLRGVKTVILDEVHAVAGTKRGAHLALSLERLDELLTRPAQRIGLSATVRPVEKVAAFLAGAQSVTVVNPPAERRLEMRIVVPVEDMSDLAASAPASGASERIGRAGSIWFHVEAGILDQVLANRSTIVFVNSRGLAERLTARLNELYAERFENDSQNVKDALASLIPDSADYESTNGSTVNRSTGLPPLIARSHHGSVSKERRADIEESLKSGELRCVVATSSLELGIDMGQVDMVIQVAAPPSVSSGLQRVGRAGHHVGGTPCGLLYPRTRRDLVDAAVTVENMLAGQLEAVNPPRNPLDILAQHTVAAVAMDTLDVDEWYALVKRSDPFKSLPRSAFDATMDMLAGRFPSDEFAEFRPRLVWDRVNGTLAPRPGAQRLAVINGGTIPDRGTFSVMLPEGEEQAGSRRVGELDEEMVYESRINDVITLGATSWRIRQITNDQVVVVPAPGKSARLPFWHGDGPGRPAELGESIGAFLRAIDPEIAPDEETEKRLQSCGMAGFAASNLLKYLSEQRTATGIVPTDHTLVVERCRDELGDWRVMLHSPYGKRVHAPWALAVSERIRKRHNLDAAAVASDDGIILRMPDTEGHLPGADLFAFDPDHIQRLVTQEVGNSALFTARFRECASRALLLPRRVPGRRSPLWQQRLRSGQLLEVAREHPDFPILLETARECLQDVYDLPALHTLMQRVRTGVVRFTEVTTETPSPFATNLLFGYVGEFMYAYDAPLAERRASLLSLDASLLSDLLGQTDLGELLDPAVAKRIEAELQRLAPDRRVSGHEGVADLLRELGPLSVAEVAKRLMPEATKICKDGPERTARDMPQISGSPSNTTATAAEHLQELQTARRAIFVTIGGERRWAAVEDAARLRDALGTALPDGIPKIFLEPVVDPVRDLVARYARTHAPFTLGQLAERLGLGVVIVHDALNRLREQGRVLSGEFGAIRPGAVPHSEQKQTTFEESINPLADQQWVWEDIFRRLRSRSLQAAREATRPVEKGAYVRQLLERQYLITPAESGTVTTAEGSGTLYGTDGVARVIEQLSGLALPASLWESHILPARVRDYAPAMLDELIATGEVLWSGTGSSHDGQIALHMREYAAETLFCRQAGEESDITELQRVILDILAHGGAYFAHQIATIIRSSVPADTIPGQEVQTPELHKALWGLVWAGRVTTDTWAPLRSLTGAQSQRPARKARTVRRRIGGTYQSITMPEKRGIMSLGDGALAGRWSLLPQEKAPDTVRALALAEGLLDRYGVVTRSAAVAEKVSGGFPALQRIFRGMEDVGRVLRGRFVEGLGAAQFADNATINRLRELADIPAMQTVVLSCADPANPYGAGIPWPTHPAGAKPTRHPGALVVIHNGALSLWLSQGGRSLLTFSGTAQGDTLQPAHALATGLQRSHANGFTIETIDDGPAMDAPVATALRAAGFSQSPRGLSWYSRLRAY